MNHSEFGDSDITLSVISLMSKPPLMQKVRGCPHLEKNVKVANSHTASRGMALWWLNQQFALPELMRNYFIRKSAVFVSAHR